MPQNLFSATKNIICIDLTNVDEKLLQSWFVLNNNLGNMTKMLLTKLVKNNQENIKDSERVARVYLQDNYVAHIMNAEYQYDLGFGFCIEDSIKEIAKLDANSNEELHQLITQIVNRINNNKRIELSELEVIRLQYFKQQLNQQIDLFQIAYFKDIVALQIAGTMDIEIKKVRSLQAIKSVYSYFKKKQDCPKSILEDLKVQQLFYKGNLLIAYTIKHPQYEDLLFCWDEDYEAELSYVERIKIDSLLYKPTLNGILDKISKYGMENLTLEEREFLEKVK